MGIDRFCARRSIPSVIWSDNGTNFAASEKELLLNIKTWNQQVFGETLVKKGIEWKFNPPSAPHPGCLQERVVRSFKHNFYAVLVLRVSEVFGNVLFETLNTISTLS